MKDYLLKPFPALDSGDAVPRGTNEPAGAIRLAPADRVAPQFSQAVPLHPSGTSAPAMLPEETSGARQSSALETPGRPAKFSTDPRHQTQDWLDAQATANLCQRFIDLRNQDYSLRQAAMALGKSVSMFSGDDSVLARYERGGVAALLPAAREPSANLTLEVPEWFVPAAQFFYLASNTGRHTGSVPEAVRRTISLPHVPLGWTASMVKRLAAKLRGCAGKSAADMLPEHSRVLTNAATAPNGLPICPVELREQILAREKAGQPLVTARLAKLIAVNRSIVQQHRSPHAWALDHLSAPGSQRRFFNRTTNQREIMQPGDWFGGDDSTPGIAVCVPCKEVITPCSQKFGVLLGRFQFLAYHDARADKVLAWDYVVRPRGSYRAEDIVNGMGAVTRAHGVPRQGWQFEGGTFNSKLVRQCIELLGCQHWRTYSPHQKAIESIFNRVWTRLAVQFPHADMGRYRAENESNCNLYEACKRGHKDPRSYFPTLDLVCAVFTEEVAAHNAKRIKSEQYGQWVPEDFFAQAVAEQPLRPFSAEMDWIFSPFTVERKVRGMMARCRVPMFEDFSVPFEFNADWMPMHNGQLVRLHFNPRQPKCTAKVVLLEAHGNFKAGQILGDAQLIGETAGHIRLIMGWADDDQRAGYIARQRTAQYLRRETRAVGHGGRAVYAKSEQRDGLGQVQTLERGCARESTAETMPQVSRAVTSAATEGAEISIPDRSARLREIEELERQNQHLFT